MQNFIDKINHSKEIIRQAVNSYNSIVVGCSFGKDSVVTCHLAKQVKRDIPVFYVATTFKPKETLEYAVKIKELLNMDLKAYLVAKEVPEVFRKAGIEVVLLPTQAFDEATEKSQKEHQAPLYKTSPDLCCNLLKVEPTKVAVKDYEAWVAGLRRDEGYTRYDYQEVERRGHLFKINPILEWTELDVWRYLAMSGIPPNPLYRRGFRSLGCSVCTKITPDDQPERAGRWKDTSKCGGECGIHTKTLK